jgi:DNA-binding XRE family transcriptional regulator
VTYTVPFESTNASSAKLMVCRALDVLKATRNGTQQSFCRDNGVAFVGGPIHAREIMMNDSMTPADLRALRHELGLSQIAMAKKLGCAIKTYNSWECGRSKIPRLLGLWNEERVRSLELSQELEDASDFYTSAYET